MHSFTQLLSPIRISSRVGQISCEYPLHTETITVSDMYIFVLFLPWTFRCLHSAVYAMLQQCITTMCFELCREKEFTCLCFTSTECRLQQIHTHRHRNAKKKLHQFIKLMQSFVYPQSECRRMYTSQRNLNTNTSRIS